MGFISYYTITKSKNAEYVKNKMKYVSGIAGTMTFENSFSLKMIVP